MSQHSDEQGLIRSYLLGELDEAGQERLEVLLLTDAAYAERVASAEDELVDEYVFEVLSPREREQFEKNYLSSPGRPRKLRIAKALDVYLDALADTDLTEDARQNTSWVGWLPRFVDAHRLKLAAAASAAALVLIGYGSWTYLENRRLEARQARSREERVAAEREIARLNVTEGGAGQQGGQLPDDAAVLSLKPYIFRDAGELRRATIEDEAGVLQLRLALAAEDEYTSYRALVKTEDGKELTVDGLRPRAVGGDRVIVLRLPAGILRTGDAEVRLVGLTTSTQAKDVGLYPFQIINKTLR